MQIGRITGLPEPTGFSQPDMSTVSFGLLATATEAKQLLDLGSNGAERFVPIVFGTALAANDGVYELLEVGVEADPNMEAAGLRQVSVSARCENQGRQVANSQLLLRGDNRNRVAVVGLHQPLYRPSIPDGATTITSYNVGPGGFTVGSAVPTLGRGSVVRLTDSSLVLAAVEVATTANITLSGTVTVDGVSVSVNGTRVLVKNQTTASQNGIYVRAAGAWTRATDADAGTELDRALVYVVSGTANAGTLWMQPASGITIGTTAQAWQQSPLFGLRDSASGGPVSISYELGLSDWYNGACTITQGGTVVTGNRVAASGTVVMDNGLVRVEGATLQMATGSPLAWGVGRDLEIIVAQTATLSSPTVIANTPDVTALRYRLIIPATSPRLSGVADISIARGSRTVTVTISLNGSSFVAVTPGTSVGTPTTPNSTTTPEAGTGSGYTSALSNMQYGTVNDADGNRWAVSCAGELVSSSGSFFSSAKRAHAFGVHAIVGGGTTKTGNDQLYGMDRAWFAMLAQQTSAGVL
jgi:hypothetical protein